LADATSLAPVLIPYVTFAFPARMLLAAIVLLLASDRDRVADRAPDVSRGKAACSRVAGEKRAERDARPMTRALPAAG
ncbi:MAG: hypothetical protein OXG72_11415, partial [Acidobacteria bacterium]|nr:hypothetical protein [Acidobacteriota bacterium]